MKERLSIRRGFQSGFTLLEMMISLALFLVLCGAILGGMATMQKNHRGTEIRSSMNQQLRASIEMMQQEISQAGLAPSGMDTSTVYTAGLTPQGTVIIDSTGAVATVSASVPAASTITANSTPTLTIASNSKVQSNTFVIADTGSNAEVIQVGAISPDYTTLSNTTFTKSHTFPFNLYPHGVYPQGIYLDTGSGTFMQPMSNGVMMSFANTTTAPVQLIASTQTLVLWGDLYGNGNINIVEYACPTAANNENGSNGNAATYTDLSGNKWGPLIRKEFDVKGGTMQPKATVIDRVLMSTATYNPSNITYDGCRFDYTISLPTSGSNCPNSYWVTNVSITLIAESLHNDPQSGQPVVVQKSFLNIAPPNMTGSYNTYWYMTEQAAASNGSPPPCSDVIMMPTGVLADIVGASGLLNY